jgi:peptidyl-prolyl cis-trans isomerase SurA
MRRRSKGSFRLFTSGRLLSFAAAGLLAWAGGAGAQSSSRTLPGFAVAAQQATSQPGAASGQSKTGAPDKRERAKPGGAPPRAAKSAASNPAGAEKSTSSGQSIIALVNDDPITAYEIEQRARLMALQSNIGERAQESFKRLVQAEGTQQRLRQVLQETIQANQGKTREQVLAIFEERKQQFAANLQRQALESARASVLPSLKKGALEELIEERLKIQEARRLNVTIEDAQVDNIIKGLAERNKMSADQFAQHLAGMGADIQSMKARYRANLAWTEVVRRRFSAQVSINQREIDRMVAASPDAEDEVELHIHRITLAAPGKLDQKIMAQRFEEADRLRRQFSGCKSTAALAAKVQDAKFEDLGHRKPALIQEPTRSLLLNAKDGEMAPPNMAAGGVELYAVCGRKVTTGDETKRDRAAQELRQKEFEVLAKRHLRDLRQDAHIEYR